MKWRKLFRAVHRDTGYIVAALTVAYVISGIAVNHIADWNPSYKFKNDRVNVGPLPKGDYKQMEQHVVSALGIDPKTVKGHFMETETEFRVFLQNSQEVRVDVRTGEGRRKRVVRRAIFYEVNALHLNNLKGIWTWIADLFALSLLVLVITGIFMMKGSRGIGGRGKWFVAAGTAIPIIFVLHLYLGCSDGLRAPPYSDSEQNFTLLAKSKLHRMTHIEGGGFSMISHYRKSGDGYALCRIEISGRYQQAKSHKRFYRFDLYNLPAGGLDKKTYKVTGDAEPGAIRLHFEMDATDRLHFTSGSFKVRTLRSQQGNKGFAVARALGGTLKLVHARNKFLGSFFVEKGIARIDGKCDVPPAQKSPLPVPTADK